MARISFLALALAACGPAGKTADTDPAPAPLLDDPEVVDSGILEIRLAGSRIGTETFEVSRRRDTLTTVSSGESSIEGEGMVRFRATLVHALDWSVEHGRYEIEDASGKCVSHVERKGGLVHARRERDGQVQELAAEPFGHARYYLGMQPSSVQLVTCALATSRPVSLTYYPGFTANLEPRQEARFAALPGKTFSRVRVDELIDVICDGTKFLVLHYGKHALTIARDGYQPIAAELSAGDPTGEPWFGRLSCR